MLDGARDDRVGEAGEGAGGVVLAVAEVPGGGQGPLVAPLVRGLEIPLGEAEGAELDRDAGPDAQQRRQRALVEGEGPLLHVYGLGGVQGRRVRRARLQAHLDYVEGLACGVMLVNSLPSIAFSFRFRSLIRLLVEMDEFA